MGTLSRFSVAAPFRRRDNTPVPFYYKALALIQYNLQWSIDSFFFVLRWAQHLQWQVYPIPGAAPAAGECNTCSDKFIPYLELLPRQVSATLAVTSLSHTWSCPSDWWVQHLQWQVYPMPGAAPATSSINQSMTKAISMQILRLVEGTAVMCAECCNGCRRLVE